MFKMHLRRNISFSELWDFIGSCYKSLCIRSIAIKEGEAWKNIMSIAFLSRKVEDEIKKEVDKDYLFLRKLKIPHVDNLGIFYDVANAENTPKYIEEMQKGRITLGHQIVNLRKGYEKTDLIEGSRIIRWGEFSEYPFLNYEFNGDGITVGIELQEKLLSLGICYGINEIGLQWLKIPQIEGYGINAIVVLPLYFNVTELYLEKAKEFCIKFRAHINLQPKLKVLLALRKRVKNTWVTIENKLFTSDEFSSQTLNDFSLSEVRYTFETLPSLEDEVYCRIITDLGVLFEDYWGIKDFTKIEFKEPFLNFFGKFININKFKEVLQGRETISQKKITPDLEFQKTIGYLLSQLGFRIMELGDTRYKTIKRLNGSDIGDVDIIAQDIETKKLYTVQCTIAPPDSRKIDVIANIAIELRMQEVFAEPIIFVRDFATEVKKNSRRVKVVDKEDLLTIISLLQLENIGEAKRKLLEFTL
jgi:hypothetical protein